MRCSRSLIDVDTSTAITNSRSTGAVASFRTTHSGGTSARNPTPATIRVHDPRRRVRLPTLGVSMSLSRGRSAPPNLNSSQRCYTAPGKRASIKSRGIPFERHSPDDSVMVVDTNHAVQVVTVEVPAAGSPAPLRQAKPLSRPGLNDISALSKSRYGPRPARGQLAASVMSSSGRSRCPGQRSMPCHCASWLT